MVAANPSDFSIVADDSILDLGFFALLRAPPRGAVFFAVFWGNYLKPEVGHRSGFISAIELLRLAARDLFYRGRAIKIMYPAVDEVTAPQTNRFTVLLTPICDATLRLI